MENIILKALLEIDESIGVRKRVRDGGKRVQRRFKFSKNKNQSYNNRTKKRTKISASDRAKMSRAQKIAAKKRQSSKSQARIKRQKSMRRRRSLGFDK